MRTRFNVVTFKLKFQQIYDADGKKRCFKHCRMKKNWINEFACSVFFLNLNGTHGCEPTHYSYNWFPVYNDACLKHPTWNHLKRHTHRIFCINCWFSGTLIVIFCWLHYNIYHLWLFLVKINTTRAKTIYNIILNTHRICHQLQHGYRCKSSAIYSVFTLTCYLHVGYRAYTIFYGKY